MICKPRDIVGIPFPYSDMTSRKRRPVLIINGPDQRGDFISLAITSVMTRELSVTIDNKSMNTGKIPKQSWIRYDKIFTLNNSIIVKSYGSLKAEVFQQVVNGLCDYLGCNIHKT